MGDEDGPSDGLTDRSDDAAVPAESGQPASPEAAATRLCEGFKHHDRRNRERAVDAFAAVDRFQFAHVDQNTARQAAAAYVDSLWAKDDVEDRYRLETDDEDAIDRDGLAEADWSPVEAALDERATLVGIDPEYATLTTTGWRRHKVGGDYWTPTLRAQQLELQTALQEPAYPEKPRHGKSGGGPEATRYLLGIELHDCRRWTEARNVMVPYFASIEEATDRAGQAGD
ncbi:hypothetical protein [Salinarchaeum chitinilyticum]